MCVNVLLYEEEIRLFDCLNASIGASVILLHEWSIVYRGTSAILIFGAKMMVSVNMREYSAS